jgi:hypothetical protein
MIKHNRICDISNEMGIRIHKIIKYILKTYKAFGNNHLKPNPEGAYYRAIGFKGFNPC